MVARFGGYYKEATRNIFNRGSLEYALSQLAYEMETVSVPDAAGRLAFRIISRHVFGDANARTGMEAAFIVLELNGYEVLATDDEVIAIGQATSESKTTENEFCLWLRRVCRRSPP